jgi:nucleotide-binding universal stress UspA family protein
MTETDVEAAAPVGPVLFAYDGSELARYAIEQAGAQLAVPRDAVVVCVWRPADVGFTPVGGQHFDADKALEVEEAAAETAAYGASLVERFGFRARGVAEKSAPTWKGIVDTAHREGASLIVIGSHRHGGLVGHLVGNVAAAVVAHATTSVLLVHAQP